MVKPSAAEDVSVFFLFRCLGSLQVLSTFNSILVLDSLGLVKPNQIYLTRVIIGTAVTETRS